MSARLPCGWLVALLGSACSAGTPGAADAGCPASLPVWESACPVDGQVCLYAHVKHIECHNPCPQGCKGGPLGSTLDARAVCESGAWRTMDVDAGSPCPVQVTCVCQGARDGGDAGS